MSLQPHSIQETAAMTLPVRVGVVLSSGRQPRWVQALLDNINHSEFAELAIVIRSDKAASEPLLHSFAGGLGTLPLRIWQRWDQRYFGMKDGLLAPVDISSEVEGKTAIDASGGMGSEQMWWLQAANLDVILHLGATALPADLASAARYGVWYCDGDGEYETALIQIMSEGERTFVTALKAAGANGSGTRVLEQTISHLRPESLYRNQQSAALLKMEIMMRRLKLLHEYGPASLPEGRQSGAGSSHIVRPGRGLSAFRFLTRWAASAVQMRLDNRRFLDHWFIAFRKSRGRRIPSDLTGFQVITPPPDRFYADPFVISRNGRSYIFFEDFRFASRKGVISCIEVDESGSYGEPVVVIENSYHMSYPHFFDWQGETYLIPETCDAKRIEAYRAVKFPYRWAREKVLMQDVLAVDPTLIEYGGRVWLFASGMSARPWAPNEELFLFSSDSLFGQWRAHPKNPIVSDVRRARPAGRLFYSDGELIRPSQDCGRTYGYATVLNRVELLSESEYREVPIATLTPDWQPGNLGTHTFDQNEDLQVLDGRVLIRRRKHNQS